VAPREYYRPRGAGVGRGGEGKLLGSGAAIGAEGLVRLSIHTEAPEAPRCAETTTIGLLALW